LFTGILGETIMSSEHTAAAFTIAEFCEAHRIGRATLYKLWSQNLGPRFFLVGSHRRIGIEAAADWRAAAEAAAREQGKL
jgi:hypothetical protein